MQPTAERWLPIPGYEGRYDVSDLGRVRSWLRSNGAPRILKLSRCGVRYMAVGFWCADGKERNFYVHRLVSEAFIGPRPDGYVTRHLNGDATDNRASNLTYGTVTENIADSIAHGTNWHTSVLAKRTHCPANHEYTEANTYIRTFANGHQGRWCRLCRNEWGRIARANATEEDRVKSRAYKRAWRARKKAKEAA